MTRADPGSDGFKADPHHDPSAAWAAGDDHARGSDGRPGGDDQAAPVAPPFTKICPECGRPSTVLFSLGHLGHCPVKLQPAGDDPMTTTDTAETETQEVTAYYDNLRVTRSGGNSPTLDCSCGKSFSADSWEEAGADLDEHLAEAAGGAS
jgi:hypothetical protein